MKLSIWDMDKTIIRRASWTPWLFHFARTEAPWRLLLAPLLLLPVAGYGLRLLDRKGLKQASHRIMLGARVPRDRVERAARSFAAGFGGSEELPGALARMAEDRAAGFRIVLATASPAIYAEALARRWGILDVIATRNSWDGDMLTPEISGPNCYGEEKLTLIKAWLPEQPTEVRFASDHVSDLPVMLWADAPLAANPSAALRQEALKRGWPVCDWA